MFKVDENQESIEQFSPGNSYLIRPEDRLTIEIYTHKGEKIIDPDKQLSEDKEITRPEPLEYWVDKNGEVDLPVIGKINLEGLTLEDAAVFLEEAYSTFYPDPYVVVNYTNKRVYILGPTGTQQQGQVIPLTSEELTITEVLAIAGGISEKGNASNIRLLRKDQVMLIDLSTFEGFNEKNVVVMPGDIIYIEPVRRPFSEFIRENSPLIGLTTGILSFTAIILSLNQ